MFGPVLARSLSFLARPAPGRSRSTCSRSAALALLGSIFAPVLALYSRSTCSCVDRSISAFRSFSLSLVLLTISTVFTRPVLALLGHLWTSSRSLDPPRVPVAAAPPWSHRRRYPVRRLACCLRHRHHHFPTPPPHPVPHRRRRTHALASTVDFALPVLRGTYSLYHNLTRLRTLGLCFARISAPPVPPPPLPS